MYLDRIDETFARYASLRVENNAEPPLDPFESITHTDARARALFQIGERSYTPSGRANPDGNIKVRGISRYYYQRLLGTDIPVEIAYSVVRNLSFLDPVLDALSYSAGNDKGIAIKTSPYSYGPNETPRITLLFTFQNGRDTEWPLLTTPPSIIIRAKDYFTPAGYRPDMLPQEIIRHERNINVEFAPNGRLIRLDFGKQVIINENAERRALKGEIIANSSQLARYGRVPGVNYYDLNIDGHSFIHLTHIPPNGRFRETALVPYQISPIAVLKSLVSPDLFRNPRSTDTEHDNSWRNADLVKALNIQREVGEF